MRRLVPVVLFVVAASCSTTATVLTRDRRTTEASIIGGDRDVLLLRNPYGLESIVRRREVMDIDHPGNVMALLGGLVLGSAGMNLGVLGSLCASGSSVSNCTPIFATMGTMAAAGAGMFIWGLWVWLTSKNAVADSTENPPVPMPAEPALPAAPPPLTPATGPTL